MVDANLIFCSNKIQIRISSSKLVEVYSFCFFGWLLKLLVHNQVGVMKTMTTTATTTWYVHMSLVNGKQTVQSRWWFHVIRFETKRKAKALERCQNWINPSSKLLDTKAIKIINISKPQISSHVWLELNLQMKQINPQKNQPFISYVSFVPFICSWMVGCLPAVVFVYNIMHVVYHLNLNFMKIQKANLIQIKTHRKTEQKQIHKLLLYTTHVVAGFICYMDVRTIR